MNDEIKKIKIEVDSSVYVTRPTAKYLQRKPYMKKDDRKITAFIPGVIRKIFVYEGKRVQKGDTLFILEAMKMQNSITAPLSGKIVTLKIREGQKVIKNDLLAEIE